MSISHHSHSAEALMRYARRLGFGDIHSRRDPETGLHTIVAIHSIKRGPAIGGCRLYPYVSSGQALKDVLRLSYMMTLKAAICDLPHGGGKSVIIQPPLIQDRTALFEAFGDFVHSLNGRYITAIDVGTGTHDMDIIATRTPYVIGAETMLKGHGNPATHTALGVFQGIKAALQFMRGSHDLNNVHVAIQGLGQVGFLLAQQLYDHGAKLTVCDASSQAVERAKSAMPTIHIVEPNSIYHVPCDIFSPCAMGGILTREIIQQLRCQAVVGSANNQLAHLKFARLVRQREILFAPDFLVNAGGLINAALIYDCADPELAHQQILKVYDTCLEIFERAKASDKTTTLVAYEIAMERLA